MSLHDPRNGARSGAWTWHAAFWPVLVLAATATFATLNEVGARVHDDHVLWLGARYDTIDRSLSRIHATTPGEHKRVVVFFGDSTVAQYEQGPPLPQLTAARLHRMRGLPWVKMLNASAPGSGIVQYGFLADHVGTFEPDLVIWQLSFFQFTRRWTSQNGAPELVGFVHADRLPEILTMPVERYGLSVADILLQQGIVRLDLHDVHRWMRESQLRFAHVIDRVEDELNPNRGRKPEARAQTLRGRSYMRRHMDMKLRIRYSAHGERVHFGRTLDGLEPDDAKLQLLRSGIRALTDEGIDVLVYLNPTNLEHLRSTGVSDGAGVALTTLEIARAVEESGATFLDLTELLSEDEFVDAAGHFVEDDVQTVPRRVTAAIAKAAMPILVERERREAKDGEVRR